MKFGSKIIVAGAALALATTAYAATHFVNITNKVSEICVNSNGIPNHATGQFPRRGNPHSIKEQRIAFCVTDAPKKGTTPKEVRTIGIAENGIIIRPGTADYYDARSPRGHSRDRSSGWNLDGMGPDNTLGLDKENAHVDNRGIYHYHGAPPSVIKASTDTRIGWAADGFEIHYIGDHAQPSYMLKRGTRPTAPFGRYDGSYNQDFEHVSGLENLDECNGATVNGKYMYFATDAYPYYPRCLFGTDITQFR